MVGVEGVEGVEGVVGFEGAGLLEAQAPLTLVKPEEQTHADPFHT